MRKVFLDDLPKGGKYIANNKINWEKSTGYKVKFIYDNIQGEIEIVSYDKSKRKLYVKYNDEINPIKADSLYFGQIGEVLGTSKRNYRYDAGDIIQILNTHIEILEQIRISNKKGYVYKCLKCGNIDQIREDDLRRNKGCNVCCSPSKKVLKGYNDIWTTHPEIAKMLKDLNRGFEISFGTLAFEIFICPICGFEKSFSVNSIVKQRKFPCPMCSDGISYPERLGVNIINQLKNLYEIENIQYQYSPNWIKPKRYDFYFEINSRKYILEIDGKWHKIDNKLSGLTKEESMENDKYKDDMARKHKIEVIRINCEKSDLNYIKNNIIDSKLAELFDLSKIDWLKCHEYACNSLVKIICDLWNSGLKDSTDIGKKVKLSHPTVVNYLKQGTKLNWCDYNPEYEKLGKKKKQTVCINTKEVFNSLKEAEYKYNISKGKVSMCCKGKQKSAGKHPITGEPLRWMYYDEYIKQQLNT